MKRLLWTLFILFFIGLAIAKLLVFEIPTISGDDMAPTLQRGDRLLAYRLDTRPRHGDLVLMELPESRRLMIRRVIGLPGDRIAVLDETPIINGKKVRRIPVQEVTLLDGDKTKMRLLTEEIEGDRYQVLKDPRRRSVDYPERRLDESYFVLSDNRNHGTDSRTFGPVPAVKIRAIVTHLLSVGPSSVDGLSPREGFSALR
jgi:signal peptidase I